MIQLLDDLHNLIKKQTSLYRKLLLVLNREKEIIKTSSVENLTKNNKKKEVLILQIKLLDESCSMILERIYSGLPACAEQPSLHHLTDWVNEPAMVPVRDGYEKLVSLVRAVKAKNCDNEKMIKGSLRAIRSSLSFIISCASSGAPLYESSGQMRAESSASPLVNEEA